MIKVTVGEQKTQDDKTTFECPCLVEWNDQILLLIKPGENKGEYVSYNFNSDTINFGFSAPGSYPVTKFKGTLTLQNIQP